jgi:hypothetical protein
VAYCGLFAIFVTQKTVFLTLLQRNQYFLLKIKDENQNYPNQHLHNSQLFPHLLTLANPRKGWRSHIQMPLFVVGGQTPVRLGYTMLTL